MTIRNKLINDVVVKLDAVRAHSPTNSSSWNKISYMLP